MFSQTQSLISRCRAWAASLICAVTLGIGNPGLGSPAPQSIRVWQTEDGLPQNSVTCLLQSRQGYLWFGTYAGLTRFDGATFTVYDSERFPGLADNRITALCEDEQGNLWIGHETGSITRFGQNGMETIELPDRAQRSEILGMAASSAGSVWVLNRGGWLVQLPQETVIEPPAVAGPMANSHGIVAENDGSVWCLRRGRLEQILADGPTLWKAPGAASPVAAQAITPAWAGGIWISIEGRVRRMHRDAWQEDPPEQPWADKAIANLEELADGGILVGTRESGLYLCDAAGRVRHFSTTNGLSQSWVRSMLQDREGTLWVGLGNGGLNAIRSVHFEGVNPPDHWGGRSVLSVTAAQDGGVWVGTEGAGLYRWRDEAWSHYAEPQGLLNRYVWSVAETRKGELLVGTWSGGLFVWDQGGLRVAPGTEGMTRPVTALMPGTGNEMWIGTRDGVGRYEAGHLTWLSPPAGTRLAEVRCLARGPDDSLWIGMNGLGLARYRPGEFQLFDEADGLGSDFISCLHFDARGDLWIGTAGGGLARYKEGRFSRIGSRQGLPSVNISTMREDGQGDNGMLRGISTGQLPDP